LDGRIVAQTVQGGLAIKGRLERGGAAIHFGL
jgi:hypothetical protein